MTPDTSYARDEIDLQTVLMALLRGWKIILACLVVAAGLAFLWGQHQPKIYTVRMVVVPALAANGRPMTAAAGANTPFNLYLQSLHAHSLADRLAANRAAVDALDPRPSGQGWTPSSTQIQRLLTRTLTVDRDLKTSPAATITLTTPNPDSGTRFLTLLHRAANDYARATAGSGEKPPAAANAVPLPATAALLFDGPYASDEPISPRLATTMRNALIAGFLIGCALIGLLALARSLRKSRQAAAK